MPLRQDQTGEKSVLVLLIQAEREANNPNDATDQMNLHNEYNLKPGPYKHYKGGEYVVTDIVTHMDNPATGKMEPLADPLVVYRDLQAPVRHVEGKQKPAHQVYARTLSEFNALIQRDNGQPVKRFTEIVIRRFDDDLKD